MIGPAGIAIKQVEPQLAALGLVLCGDTDYAANFSSATHTLRVTSEPRDLGLCVSLRNAHGETFELGLLAHLLAPEDQAQAQERALHATNVQESYDLTSLVRFLHDNEAVVFEQPAPISLHIKKHQSCVMQNLACPT